MSDRSYLVTHRTSYSYSATMTDGYTVAVLVPRPTPWQRVVSADIVLSPAPSETDSFLDAFGNLVTAFGLHEPHSEVSVEAVSRVVTDVRSAPVDDTPWETVAQMSATMTGEHAFDVGFFTGSSFFVDLDSLGGSLSTIARRSFDAGRPIIDGARDLCTRIYEEYSFDPSFSDTSTPLGDVLDERRGVCQDFAHLAVGCLRSVGLAARYVSGYIETEPLPGQSRLVGADASHAWCSVWTPRAGWVDFDPTNGHLPTNRHVTVAWGRDYADVTPVRGVMIGPSATQHMEVSVDVRPG